MSVAVLPKVNAAEREMMDHLLATQSLDHTQATRLQVVLGRAEARPTSEIAAVLRIHAQTVSDIVKHATKRSLTKNQEPRTR
jgi:hypothetical protein